MAVTIRLPLAALLAVAALHGAPAAAASIDERFMAAGDPADAPAGFDEMCARDATLCGGPAEGVEAPPPVFAAAQPAPCVPAGPTFRPVAALSFTPSVFETPSGMLLGANPFAAQPAPPCGVTDWRVYIAGVIAAPIERRGPVFSTGAVLEQRRAAPLAHAATLPSGRREMGMPLLRRINSSVNRNTVQVSDLDQFGVEEYWTRLGPGKHPAGDCEDIAIEKRIRLVEAGFPADRLFLAVAWHVSYGLHTMLIARLGDGDYVLDSLTSRIARWSRTRYHWVRRQSSEDPRLWLRVGYPSQRSTLVQQADSAARLS